MAATYDIVIDQGGSFSVKVTMLDNANNNILSSATAAKAQIRETPQDTIVLAEMDCEFAEGNEYLTISLSPAQTANLDIKTMFWDLQVTWPDRIEYLLKGKAKLNYTVTR